MKTVLLTLSILLVSVSVVAGSGCHISMIVRTSILSSGEGPILMTDTSFFRYDSLGRMVWMRAQDHRDTFTYIFEKNKVIEHIPGQEGMDTLQTHVYSLDKSGRVAMIQSGPEWSWDSVTGKHYVSAYLNPYVGVIEYDDKGYVKAVTDSFLHQPAHHVFRVWEGGNMIKEIDSRQGYRSEKAYYYYPELEYQPTAVSSLNFGLDSRKMLKEVVYPGGMETEKYSYEFYPDGRVSKFTKESNGSTVISTLHYSCP